MKRLVILAPNWLGDAVMALPAIADLRRASPSATIAVAARAAIAPLFSLVPGVDETIVLQRPATIGRVGGWRSIGAELAGRDFDTALLLPNSMHAALVAARAGIAERWGYRSSWRGRLLTRAIRRPSRVHQAEYYQHLVSALGFPNGPDEPRIVVPDSAREAAARILKIAGWNGVAPLMALAPGAAYGGAKRWPPAYFAELAALLAGDRVTCVLVGSSADAPTALEVRRAFPSVLDIVGQTDLPALAGVMTLCRGLVTNDSGAMHVAAAAGTSVTAVFGPTNEAATRPIGEKHVVLINPVWCRPCMLRECPLDHRCMRGMRAATVADAARRSV
jgi:lipopolysaccharide heptosyltransferase II